MKYFWHYVTRNRKKELEHQSWKNCPIYIIRVTKIELIAYCNFCHNDKMEGKKKSEQSIAAYRKQTTLSPEYTEKEFNKTLSCSEGRKVNNSADNIFIEIKLNATYTATACVFWTKAIVYSKWISRCNQFYEKPLVSCLAQRLKHNLNISHRKLGCTHIFNNI